MFPGTVNGCGHGMDGTISCNEGLGRLLPEAAFQSVAFDLSFSGGGLRPDGRVVHLRTGAITTPSVPRRFTEAVSKGVDQGCGLTADHRVYCWNQSGNYPKE